MGMANRTANKQGRPKKPPDQVKGTLLQVRLDAAEKQGFADAARLAGQEISVWVRAELRRAAQKALEEHGQAVPFLPAKAGP